MTSLSRPIRPILLASAALACFVPQAVRAQTAPAPAPAPAPAATGKRVYVPADFVRFAPKNALDMLRPGARLHHPRSRSRNAASARRRKTSCSTASASSNKSGGAVGELEKIPAANVERIEIVNAATLDIAGLNGQVANIIVKADKKASGQFSWRPEFRAHFTDPILTRGDISYSGKTGPIDYNVGLNSGGSRSGGGRPDHHLRRRRRPVRISRRRMALELRQSQAQRPLHLRRPRTPRSAASTCRSCPISPSYDEDSERIRPDGVDRTRSIHQKTRRLSLRSRRRLFVQGRSGPAQADRPSQGRP